MRNQAAKATWNKKLDSWKEKKWKENEDRALRFMLQAYILQVAFTTAFRLISSAYVQHQLGIR